MSQSKVVINFTEDAILNGHAYALHPETINIQLADKKVIHPEILQEVRKLTEQGYSISIDDYKAYPENNELYALSELITINILEHTTDEIGRLVKAGKNFDSMFLAKKIENQEQFFEVKNLGFQLFQGYFFQRPKTNKVRKISSAEMIRFEILEMLCSDEVDFGQLSNIITKDASLSVRLLKLLNSPVYGLVQKVKSLKQAVVYLGLEHLKQWLRIIILTDLEQPDTTKELLRLSLLRAKFLENIGSSLGDNEQLSRLFILGLFSLLDSMYQMPMDKVMNCLSALDQEIQKTLSGDETLLSPWLKLAVSMGNSNWPEVGAISANLNLDPGDLMPSYLDALQWANKAMQATAR